MLDPADNRTLPLPVTGETHLRFASPDSLCRASLGTDLLGDWFVTEAWSAAPGKRGGGKRIAVGDAQEGLLALKKIASRREQHGYMLVPHQPLQ